MKKLMPLLMLFVLMNYANAKITCNPADMGNGSVCISDVPLDSHMVASAVSAGLPSSNGIFIESKPTQ